MTVFIYVPVLASPSLPHSLSLSLSPPPPSLPLSLSLSLFLFLIRSFKYLLSIYVNALGGSNSFCSACWFGYPPLRSSIMPSHLQSESSEMKNFAVSHSCAYLALALTYWVLFLAGVGTSALFDVHPLVVPLSYFLTAIVAYITHVLGHYRIIPRHE